MQAEPCQTKNGTVTSRRKRYNERYPREYPRYLDHKDIQHTIRYTELLSDRFKGFSDD